MLKKLEDTEHSISTLIKNTRVELESNINEFNKVKKFIINEINKYFEEQTNKFSIIYDQLNSVGKNFQESMLLCRKKINFSEYVNNHEINQSIEFSIKDSNDNLKVIKEHEKNLLNKALDISNKAYNMLKSQNLELLHFKKLYFIELDEKQSKEIDKKSIKNNSIMILNKDLIIDDMIEKNQKIIKNQQINQLSLNNSNQEEIKENISIKFLNNKRTKSDEIKVKMSEKFNKKFLKGDFTKLEKKILNSLSLIKKNAKICELKEEIKEMNLILTNFLKFNIISSKIIKSEYLQIFSDYFKTYIMSEKKDGSKYCYFIGGEIKSSYYQTILKLIVSIIKIEKEFDFYILIENFSFIEDMLTEITSPLNKITKHNFNGLSMKEIINKNYDDRGKIQKERDYFNYLKQDVEVLKID